MALETIVRPAVFPDIRPGNARDARSDDPSRGRAVIGGGGGQVIDLAQSQSSSTQKQHVNEEYRVSDIIRVYRIKTRPKPPPGAVGPAYDPKAQLRSNETIDYNVYTDQENMWQVITVLHTGQTIRTYYRRIADHLAEDYPKGNAILVTEYDDPIIRNTGKGRGLVDLILP